MDIDIIEKLGELSMIDIDGENIEKIESGLDELVEQLKMVKELSLDCEESKDSRRTIIKEDRMKDNVDINEVNRHIKDGYVRINRTVGE